MRKILSICMMGYLLLSNQIGLLASTVMTKEPKLTLPVVEPTSSAAMITIGVAIFLVSILLIVFIQLRQNKNKKEDE